MTSESRVHPTVSFACGAFARGALLAVTLAWGLAGRAEAQQRTNQISIDEDRARQLYVSNKPEDHPVANYEMQIERKARTDSIFAAVSEGVVDYRKITYRSSVGDMDIPAYVFQPLRVGGAQAHAAMIWVHGGVHGNWTENYWPFIKRPWSGAM